MNMHRMNRREWMAAASAAAALTFAPRAQAKPPAMPPVCVFSKHLQFLDFPALAQALKSVGADGVDLTVRPGGHVLPGDAARDLPRAVEALKSEGLAVAMATTRLTSIGDSDALPTFQALQQSGVAFVRVGGHKYPSDGDPVRALEAITADCRQLAEMAAAHGLSAGYHNHSGKLNFGAPLWDLLRVIEAVGAPHFGSNFDVGHCMVEGPYGDWDLTARALAPHTRMLAVKDFRFVKAAPRWTPLGEGIVPVAEFLKRFHSAGFSGPVSIHFEYDGYNDATEDGKLEQIAAAVKLVRGALAEAGYTA